MRKAASLLKFHSVPSRPVLLVGLLYIVGLLPLTRLLSLVLAIGNAVQRKQVAYLR